MHKAKDKEAERAFYYTGLEGDRKQTSPQTGQLKEYGREKKRRRAPVGKKALESRPLGSSSKSLKV